MDKTKISGIQVVDFFAQQATCRHCGADLKALGNIKFCKKVKNTPTMRREGYVCLNCGTPFVMDYPIFTDDGHINPLFFSEDPNNPGYNWYDIFSESQKDAIAEHLNSCKECQEKLTEELLSNAWFASLIRRKKGI